MAGPRLGTFTAMGCVLMLVGVGACFVSVGVGLFTLSAGIGVVIAGRFLR